jgi:hypothetical protein
MLSLASANSLTSTEVLAARKVPAESQSPSHWILTTSTRSSGGYQERDQTPVLHTEMQRAQRHRDVIPLVAAALVLDRIHDHDRVHECRQGCLRSPRQVGELLPSRTIQLPSVHASDAELGPELLPAHPLIRSRRPPVSVGKCVHRQTAATSRSRRASLWVTSPGPASRCHLRSPGLVVPGLVWRRRASMWSEISTPPLCRDRLPSGTRPGGVRRFPAGS